jgi:hypothetical protein
MFPIYFYNQRTAYLCGLLVDQRDTDQPYRKRIAYEQRKEALVFKTAADRDAAYRRIFDRDPAPDQWA